MADQRIEIAIKDNARDIETGYQEEIQRTAETGRRLPGEKYRQRQGAAGEQQKFVFEILETVKVKDDVNFNLTAELTLLEQIWLDKLQLFGTPEFNTDTGIRKA